jgi:LPXTG-motif cell wall-anchored protein
MRTRTVLSAAVFGLTVLAPTAMAAEGASIGIQDKDIHAGQAVAVVASCDGANFTGSKVTSAVLESEDLGSIDPGEKAYTSAKVKLGTKPGHYALSFVCNGKTISGGFDVASGGAVAVAGGDQLPTAGQSDDVDDTVAAPAPPADGPDYTLIALGGAGVLLVGGAAILMLRRRRRD